jgi:flavorubredoxin
MSINSKAQLLTSARGAKMAQTYYKIPENRIRAVADGETVTLGDKTLRFIDAPMLHWPETMFTYVPENKALFPCDFLGAHVAQGLFDDEVDDVLVLAQRYYGEIMMPFSSNARKGLEKIKDLPIELVGPSHGPVYKNPKRIIEKYEEWSKGETRNKACIVYASMWGSTEKMIRPISDTLASEGIETVWHNLAVADLAEIAKDLVDSRAIVLGTPTVLNGAHPLAMYAAYLVRALKPPAKYAVVLTSFGWGRRSH